MRYITEQELRDSFAGGVALTFCPARGLPRPRWPSNTCLGP